MGLSPKLIFVAMIIWLGAGFALFWMLLCETQNFWLVFFVTSLFVAFPLLGFVFGLTQTHQRQKLMPYRPQEQPFSQHYDWHEPSHPPAYIPSQSDQLSLLMRLMHRFISAASVQDVLTALLEEPSSFFGVEEAEVIVLSDGITPMLHGVWDAATKQVQVGERKVLPTNSAWTEALFRKVPIEIRNTLILPVVIGEKVIALFRLTRFSSFTPEEHQLLKTVVNQASLAFERSKFIVFLEQLATTDPLTGAANRRHLEMRLSEEVERARRYQYPLATLMIDLNDFKKVNDTYGHQAGDAVLQQVVQTLRRILRRTDFLARYGGDEFVVLAPQTAIPNAVALAERLCKAVASKLVVINERLSIPAAINIGVAVFPEHAQNETELIKVADIALYQAKQSGQSCAKLYEPSMQGREM